MKSNILIIDDDRNLIPVIQLVLKDEYDLHIAATGKEGIMLFKKGGINAVLLDLGLPDVNGLEILEQLRAINNDVPVIIFTANKEIPTAVQAVKRGAFDYLDKPVDRGRLLTTLRNAVELDRRRRESQALIKEAQGRIPIIGKSQAIREILSLIDRIAATDVPILITGETGTGKELIANLIHYKSTRAGNRFQPVNMAGIPAELLESELFGHEKGAFTSAVSAKDGLLCAANGGTLFLDEIGLVPLKIQGKTLRAIETKEFNRVGSTASIKVDIRVVSATNKDLESEIEEGNFLPDLYYRLNALSIHIPPLRERPDDIALLIEHFMTLRSAEFKVGSRSFASHALRILLEHPWPGNARELKNVIDRLLLLTSGDVITGDDVTRCLASRKSIQSAPDDLTLRGNLDRLEREHIRKVLTACDGNVTRAAEMLGIHRVSLHKKLRALGLIDEIQTPE